MPQAVACVQECSAHWTALRMEYTPQSPSRSPCISGLREPRHQYSSVSMIVSTRAVTEGSAASSLCRVSEGS